MKKEQVIRAWKDEEFRNTLTEEECNSIPPNPAGMINISDTELQLVTGGQEELAFATEWVLSFGCCPGFTSTPNFCTLTPAPTPNTQHRCECGGGSSYACCRYEEEEIAY